MLFDKHTLFGLASLIGHPLRIDEATANLKRPSVARVQVEIDLLRPRPPHIWIGLGENDGYWQRIEYETIPDYCQLCWHVGHHETLCHAQNRAGKMINSAPPQTGNNQAPKQKTKMTYVAKTSNLPILSTEPITLENTATASDSNAKNIQPPPPHQMQITHPKPHN